MAMGSTPAGCEKMMKDEFGRHRAIENFVGVVLNPPRRRIVLRNLAVGASEDSPVLTDHETGRAGGALIDGEYARHRQLIRR